MSWTTKLHKAIWAYVKLREAALSVEVDNFENAGKALEEALEEFWNGELRDIGDWLEVKEAKKQAERALCLLDYAGKGKTLAALKEAEKALRGVRKVLAKLAKGGA